MNNAAIMHKYWDISTTDDSTIIGYWPEDGSTYKIACPLQLRDELISMQHFLVDKTKAVTSLEKELKERESTLYILKEEYEFMHPNPFHAAGDNNEQ